MPSFKSRSSIIAIVLPVSESCASRSEGSRLIVGLPGVEVGFRITMVPPWLDLAEYPLHMLENVEPCGRYSTANLLALDK